MNLNSSGDDKENASVAGGKKSANKSPKSTPNAKKTSKPDEVAKTKTSPNTSRKRSTAIKNKEEAAKKVDDLSEPASASTPSRKRTAATRDKDDNDADDAASDVSSINMNMPTSFHIHWDCNQLRRRIGTYLEHGDLNQTQLQKKLGVSPNSFRNFMTAKGANGGINSDTYTAAHIYFSRREERGYKQPRAKRRKTSEADLQKSNVDDMPTIDDEKEGAVKVYDTCDDVRTKINSYLRKTGITKVAFAKELSKCQSPDDSRDAINAAGITKFQRKKGPLAGNSNKVFYASYVFFEKLRLKEGKAKSKKRQEMEEVHGAKGVLIDRPLENIHFKMIQGDSVYYDKYGKFRNSRGTW